MQPIISSPSDKAATISQGLRVLFGLNSGFIDMLFRWLKTGLVGSSWIELAIVGLG